MHHLATGYHEDHMKELEKDTEMNDMEAALQTARANESLTALADVGGMAWVDIRKVESWRVSFLALHAQVERYREAAAMLFLNIPQVRDHLGVQVNEKVFDEVAEVFGMKCHPFRAALTEKGGA